MHTRIKQIVGSLLVPFLMLVFPVSCLAASSSVSIGVGDTLASIQGYTSPNALVEIRENGAVLNTVSADANGLFSTILMAQSPSIRNISFTATALTLDKTDEINLNVNLAANATTSVKVFLPTTINLGAKEVARGNALVLKGQTRPAATVTINVDNGLYISLSAANNNGDWSLEIPTGSLSIGTHGLFAVVNDNEGGQSYPTTTRTFAITAPETVPLTEDSPSKGNTSKDNPRKDSPYGGYPQYIKPTLLLLGITTLYAVLWIALGPRRILFYAFLISGSFFIFWGLWILLFILTILILVYLFYIK